MPPDSATTFSSKSSTEHQDAAKEMPHPFSVGWFLVGMVEDFLGRYSLGVLS